ncbi:uncharacterized protein I206_101219 [Kwoniella pini CBS 10737]|uniref:Mss4-like protein n=1 Tax=Kwoniella pini CBS 10737 TaxID=1296096 RepID=A0A1B9IAZ6_9TREE|nr:uncharacterized protein I206_00104 [Kwoniella pini CBS 10737]OCF52808.1 hypothetical protein I206_00104 [Kwoniella pini CBS 10737]
MTQPTQAEIFAALSAQSSSSSRFKPSTKEYTSFENPKDEIVSSSNSLNNRKIYCSREKCSSLILLKGVAKLIEIEGSILPDDSSSPFIKSSSPHLYWSIPSGPFSFENIGFSRPDTSIINDSLPNFIPKDVNEKSKIKWLICAECDLGPIGWSFEGGKGAWLDVKRLRYEDVKSD